MPKGSFIGIDLAILTAMQADWVAALHAVAKGNQSYSLAGRTFTRANLAEISDTLGEISYAIRLASGTVQTRTYADLSNGP